MSAPVILDRSPRAILPLPAPYVLALPVPRKPRYRSLDHWRGVACLLVAFGHCATYLAPTSASAGVLERGVRLALAKSVIGVPMFFVISGYYWWVNFAGPLGRWLTPAAFALLASATLALKSPAWWGWMYFLEGSAFALILLALHRWDDRLASSRILWPLGWCGGMCYSLYLVHLPVTKAVSHAAALWGLSDLRSTLLLTLPVGVGTSIIVARLFYLAFERRFLNLPQASGASR